MRYCAPNPPTRLKVIQISLEYEREVTYFLTILFVYKIAALKVTTNDMMENSE